MTTLFFLLCVAAEAPTGVTDIEQLSLDDLLNPKVEVVTKTALSSKDTPGIVSVITREEMLNSGAQYLMDVLQLIPGFSFGVDVEGVVGVGFRGIWGHEGKVLLLVDGIEMNENQYGTTQFGSHIPVDAIQRVEIIRGPGSAIYGGYAGLAVINVITRSYKDHKGVSAGAMYGHYTRGPGRGGLSVTLGEETPQGLAVSFQGFAGLSNRSDATYTDYEGNSYSMLDNSRISEVFVNLGVKYRDLRMRFLYDDHVLRIRDGFGPVEAETVEERFRTIAGDARYELRLAESVTLTPRLNFKAQTPWEILDKTSPLFGSKSNSRLLGNLILSWDVIADLNVLFGVEGYWDHGQVNDQDLIGLNSYYDGKLYVNYGDFAAYTQAVWKNFIVNVTVGARYEYHSAFGSSFVPRVALTKVVSRFNFKLLFAQAFRAPSIENLNINPALRPERTNTAEAEAGLKITDNMQLTVNGFWGRIDRPIIYAVTTSTDPETGEAVETEAYINAAYVGSSGVEAEYRFKYGWGFAAVTYSFYTSAKQNAVPEYAVPGNDNVLLGMPAHKVTLNSAFNLYQDHLVLGVSGMFMSTRYGYTAMDPTTGELVLGSLPPQALVNAALFYRNLVVKGFDVGVGVNNIIGTTYQVFQPYNGGHPPLPLHSREIFARVGYTYTFQ